MPGEDDRKTAPGGGVENKALGVTAIQLAGLLSLTKKPPAGQETPLAGSFAAPDAAAEKPAQRQAKSAPAKKPKPPGKADAGRPGRAAASSGAAGSGAAGAVPAPAEELFPAVEGGDKEVPVARVRFVPPGFEPEPPETDDVNAAEGRPQPEEEQDLAPQPEDALQEADDSAGAALIVQKSEEAAPAPAAVEPAASQGRPDDAVEIYLPAEETRAPDVAVRHEDRRPLDGKVPMAKTVADILPGGLWDDDAPDADKAAREANETRRAAQKKDIDEQHQRALEAAGERARLLDVPAGQAPPPARPFWMPDTPRQAVAVDAAPVYVPRKKTAGGQGALASFGASFMGEIERAEQKAADEAAALRGKTVPSSGPEPANQRPAAPDIASMVQQAAAEIARVAARGDAEAGPPAEAPPQAAPQADEAPAYRDDEQMDEDMAPPLRGKPMEPQAAQARRAPKADAAPPARGEPLPARHQPELEPEPAFEPEPKPEPALPRLQPQPVGAAEEDEEGTTRRRVPSWDEAAVLFAAELGIDGTRRRRPAPAAAPAPRPTATGPQPAVQRDEAAGPGREAAVPAQPPEPAVDDGPAPNAEPGDSRPGQIPEPPAQPGEQRGEPRKFRVKKRGSAPGDGG